MKKKIKKLLRQLSNKPGLYTTSIKIHGDESGRVYDALNKMIFEFSNIKQLKKGLKNLIKEENK